MKRFEITENFYLSKALLKMAGGGMHPPHPPLDPPLLIAVHFDFCRWACVFLADYSRLLFVLPICVFLLGNLVVK